ncbi:hypothetical protein LINGRAHAP2_LOCUS35764 [Linum grandiflorum]
MLVFFYTLSYNHPFSLDQQKNVDCIILISGNVGKLSRATTMADNLSKEHPIMVEKLACPAGNRRTDTTTQDDGGGTVSILLADVSQMRRYGGRRWWVAGWFHTAVTVSCSGPHLTTSYDQ